MKDVHTITDAIQSNGYWIARGLLNAHEIAKARDCLAAHFTHSGRFVGLGQHQSDAALAVDSLNWMIFHPAIVETFFELTGRREVQFTGNCDAHKNMLSWWHKDIGIQAQEWVPNGFIHQKCGVLFRAGIYLQDHDINRQGFSIREGSHRAPGIHEGESIYLPTRAGDVVFFDMRLTHAGQMADPVERLLLRTGQRPSLVNASVALKRAYWRLKGVQDKFSVFFTYGVPCEITARFMAYELKQRAVRTPELI